MTGLRATLTPPPCPRDPWQLAGDVVVGLFLFYIVTSGAVALLLAVVDLVRS